MVVGDSGCYCLLWLLAVVQKSAEFHTDVTDIYTVVYALSLYVDLMTSAAPEHLSPMFQICPV